MKLAHVTATFPPYWAGTGNVAYHNARLMHERGHDVTVFTAKTAKADELVFPFKVERLPALFRIGNAPLTPSLVGKLRGFDIIHLHYPYIFGAELALLASKRYRIPLVLTYHNDLLAGGLRGSIFKLYSKLNQRLVLRLSTMLAATSTDYARNSLFGKTIPTSRTFEVIPNGVDTTAFIPGSPTHISAELGLPEAIPLVLFVGGLDRAHYFKGVHLLLSALTGLQAAHAVLVGEGDLRAHYENQARTMVPGRVHFAGKVPLQRLIELYQAATVTVLPSITQGEAFGMVLIESLACGTPVIASALPGVRTVVSDGVDGYLVKPGDAKALSDLLGKLLSDPTRAREMGRAGREKVKRLYDWQIIGDRLEHLYHEALHQVVAA